MRILSKLLSTVYSLKPGVTLESRRAALPEIHLALERWYHELPSPLRASTPTPAKAPHCHILGALFLDIALRQTLTHLDDDHRSECDVPCDRDSAASTVSHSCRYAKKTPDRFGPAASSAESMKSMRCLSQRKSVSRVQSTSYVGLSMLRGTLAEPFPARSGSFGCSASATDSASLRPFSSSEFFLRLALFSMG